MRRGPPLCGGIGGTDAQALPGAPHSNLVRLGPCTGDLEDEPVAVKFVVQSKDVKELLRETKQAILGKSFARVLAVHLSPGKVPVHSGERQFGPVDCIKARASSLLQKARVCPTLC